MAGDWIKMRVALPDDCDVLRIADQLQIDEFSVCGRLLVVWGWADENTTDGFVPGGTAARIDKKAGVAGFAAAMSSVGWLSIEPDGVRFLGWEVHNSKTAKTRAKEAKKKQLQRSGKSVSPICPPSPGTNEGTETGTNVPENVPEKKGHLFSSLSVDSSSSFGEVQEGADAISVLFSSHADNPEPFTLVPLWCRTWDGLAGTSKCNGRMASDLQRRLIGHWTDPGWRELAEKGFRRLAMGPLPLPQGQTHLATVRRFLEKEDYAQQIGNGHYDKFAARPAADANNDAIAEYLRRKEADLASGEAGEFAGTEGAFDA